MGQRDACQSLAVPPSRRRVRLTRAAVEEGTGVRVRVFEHDALPVEAVGKRDGDVVVVVFRPPIPAPRRAELLDELLAPDELEVLHGG